PRVGGRASATAEGIELFDERALRARLRRVLAEARHEVLAAHATPAGGPVAVVEEEQERELLDRRVRLRYLSTPDVVGVGHERRRLLECVRSGVQVRLRRDVRGELLIVDRSVAVSVFPAPYAGGAI